MKTAFMLRRSDAPTLGRSDARAFSLIEIIGVLTILSVLAALLMPSCIKRIDIATRNQEKLNLAGITDALTKSLLRGHNVPDYKTWNAQAASWSEMPVSKVSTNARRYQRVYYSLNTPSVTLPYPQDYQGLAAPPQRMRAVLVSILGGNALGPGNSLAAGPLNDADFAPLWDLPDGTSPNNVSWGKWTGDDFLVSKIDYAPLFHRLVLVNRDPDIQPTFRIDDSTAIFSLYKTGPANPIWDKYYVHGTVVGLCDSVGVPETRYVLTQDISFVFEKGMWHAQIMGGVETSGQADEFAKQAARFLNAAWCPTAKGGADQQTALVPMYTFMLTYTYWANYCPHFPIRASSAIVQPEYELLLDFAGKGGSTPYNLNAITGTLGLLK